MAFDSPFDRAYYERFYYNTRTAVTSAIEARNRARLIAAHAEYIGLPVKRILDAGCGTGMLQSAVAQATEARHLHRDGDERIPVRALWLGPWSHPGLQVEAAIRSRSLLRRRAVPGFPKTAKRALNNLARLCRGMLYFTALTKKDWEENCDQSRTDAQRPSANRRVVSAWTAAPTFSDLGSGFWLRRGVPLTVWDLESGS